MMTHDANHNGDLSAVELGVNCRHCSRNSNRGVNIVSTIFRNKGCFKKGKMR